MSNFTLYPRLREKHIENIDYKKTKINFSFNNDDEITKINVSDSDNNYYSVRDIDNKWLYKFSNLIIDKNIEFSPKFLFGSNGIAPRNATIGFAVAWESITSLTRGIKEEFEFSHNSTINEDINIYFDKRDIKDVVRIKLVLFLKRKATIIEDNEEHLNNLEGSILGVLDEFVLDFLGDGSSFPVEEIEDRNKPLWHLNINYDTLDDMAHDSIALIINKSHKDYSLFDYNSKRYNLDFITEVMINVVVMLISEILSKDDMDIILNDNFNEGSIGSLIKYYVSIYDLEKGSLTSIHSTISRGLRKWKLKLCRNILQKTNIIP